MPPFRRVEAYRAGPTALGILVPPGERTVVILRPRALDWDLLPLRFDQGTNSRFHELSRDAAAVLARSMLRTLEQGAGPAQVVLNPGGDGYLAWLPAVDLMWIVCRRLPGQPYAPLAFSSPEDAQAAIERLTPYLWPSPDAGQEYYFNTQNFSNRPGGQTTP